MKSALRKVTLADEKKEEIVVKAPSKPATTLEKKTQKTAERAFEEERYDVLEVPKRVGKYFGMLSLATGIIVVGLLLYSSFSGQANFMFLSLKSGSPVAGLWFFVGLVTVVVGFLLMGSE